MMRQDAARERLDFREPHRLPSERLPSDACGLDAAAYGQVAYHGFTTSNS